ncbi:MAG: hypothetical protein WKF81_00985, partial [Thermomicrobiales bacterium]
SLPEEAIRSVTRRDRIGSSSGRFDGRSSGPLASSVTSSWSSSGVRSSTPVPTESLPDFQAGMKVFHAKFGEGLIDEVVDKQNDKEIAVNFARHGKKRLLGSLAKLEILA